MITLQRSSETPEPTARAPRGAPAQPASPRTRRLSVLLVVAISLAFLGGIAAIDRDSALALQERALAVHAQWAYMRDNGVPARDLAGLEQEWKRSQASRFIGSASVFWLPGAVPTVNRWEAQTTAIWERNLASTRVEAVAAANRVHDAIGNETYVKHKVRLLVLNEALTPRDFVGLRDQWNLEAALVPIDRAIADSVALVNGQMKRASRLGIRADPASRVLGRAAAYVQMSDPDRFARSDALETDLAALRADLEGRLDAATVTTNNFDRTSSEISVAGLYGVRLGALLSRVAQARSAFASSLTVAGFNKITDDLKQIHLDADHAIYVVLQQTRIIGGVPMIFQNHPLSCEEAATSMALAHQGIHVSQDRILAELGADRRPMYVDGSGRVRWGNPYKTFVGNVNGSESNYTGFGTFYPPLVRVARAHGAKILAYGPMSAATIYARLHAGHPVVVFSTWDWRWHPRRDYLSFDGRWIPWIGPSVASHVYTAVGISPTRVLINDPIRGQYWVTKAAFEAGYSDFREAIVFA
jgi:uncharacterized protein YvpB